MTDFFHEFQWQGKHMHTFHFEVNDQGETYCPHCGDIYRKKTKKPMSAPFIAAWMMIRRIQNEEQERLNSLSNQQLTTTNSTKVTLPEPPKQEVSRLAQISFLLIFAALGSLISTLIFLAAGIGVAVLVGIILCGFSLLTSISLGILSLRENL